MSSKDDLKNKTKLKDDLKTSRRPQFFDTARRPQFFEDKRQPHFYLNGRQPKKECNFNQQHSAAQAA